MKKTNAPERLLPLAHSLTDACKRIGVGRTTMYHLVKSGQIKALKIASKPVILESELQRFLSDLERTSSDSSTSFFDTP